MTASDKPPLRICLCLVACLTVATAGCGSGNKPQPRMIKVAYDPLQQARSHLEGYALGYAVGSEVELFTGLVDDVRKSDPEVADWLGQGLADIAATPANARPLAKKLLDRLDQQAAAPSGDANP